MRLGRFRGLHSPVPKGLGVALWVAENGSLAVERRSAQRLRVLTRGKPRSNSANHHRLDDELRVGHYVSYSVALGVRMEGRLVDEILSWPPAVTGCDLGALTSHLSYQVRRRLSEDEVNNTVMWLTRRGLLARQGDHIWRSEPDRPELELYPQLERLLISHAVLDALGILTSKIVFQKTASGGRAGNGRLSRPDFTLAYVRSTRFQRCLDVYSFEVKNRNGAELPSVFEAVAHGRLSHFPYLVCPRSRLFQQKMNEIRAACVAQKVGLILFDIEEDGEGSFALDNVVVEALADRRTPPTEDVQSHLEKRFNEQNCAALEKLAAGT